MREGSAGLNVLVETGANRPAHRFRASSRLQGDDLNNGRSAGSILQPGDQSIEQGKSGCGAVRVGFIGGRQPGQPSENRQVVCGLERGGCAEALVELLHDEDEQEHHQVTDGGQITRDNVYGCLEDDAFRRDFTVNALYYDPNTEHVIDYVDGVAHLHSRRILTIGDNETRFTEDPVRMLRAIRFSEKLGLELDESMQQAIARSAQYLHHVPPSRMLDEILKLFHNV